MADQTITRWQLLHIDEYKAPDGEWVRYEDHAAALERAHADLGECYRLTGADPDFDEDWRLASFAVAEVKRLREESAAAHDALDEVRANYDGACRTIALMHEAATGRAGEAPVRGVVEDMADVRAQLAAALRERDEARAEAARYQREHAKRRP